MNKLFVIGCFLAVLTTTSIGDFLASTSGNISIGEADQSVSTTQAPVKKAQQADAPDSPKAPVISDEHKQDILKLLTVNGEIAARFNSLTNAVTVYKKGTPGVPEEFWKQNEDVLTKEKVAELLVPVYAAKFNHEETKQLIQFLSSPIGQKFLKDTPGVIGESTRVINAYGLSIGKEYETRLKAEGFSR